MPGYLDEYLIRLGFTTDSAGFARFSHALADAASLVDNRYIGMAKTVFGFQTAVMSAFAAVGGGVLGFADKAAMADQDYRLLALHMYTSLPVARELKVALDALGQPLENVLWDPELGARFHQLIKDQQVLTQELGPDFEKNMFKIRDVRFEFTRLGVTIENYLIPMVVNDLAKAFGTNIDGLLEKFRRFNDYLISNMPEIANVIATKLKPILLDVKDIFWSTVDAIKAFETDFIRLVGTMTGDKKLQQSTGNIKDLATAIDEVAHSLKTAIVDLLNFETGLGHLFGAAVKANKGDWSGAWKEMQNVGDYVGATGWGYKEGERERGLIKAFFTGNQHGIPQETIRQNVIAQASSMGLPVDIALAIAKKESNFSEFNDKGGVLTNPDSGALGVMQLLPDTARQYNVDPNNISENIFGGLSLLKDLLKKYNNDEFQALSHYGGKGGIQSQQYAREVMGLASSGPINITINVAKTDAQPHEIAAAVDKVLQERVTRPRDAQTQRNISELSGWAYNTGQ